MARSLAVSSRHLSFSASFSLTETNQSQEIWHINIKTLNREDFLSFKTETKMIGNARINVT